MKTEIYQFVTMYRQNRSNVRISLFLYYRSIFRFGDRLPFSRIFRRRPVQSQNCKVEQRSDASIRAATFGTQDEDFVIKKKKNTGIGDEYRSFYFAGALASLLLVRPNGSDPSRREANDTY